MADEKRQEEKKQQQQSTLLLLTGGTVKEQQQFVDCWQYNPDKLWQFYRFHMGPTHSPWPWSRLQNPSDCSQYGLWTDAVGPLVVKKLGLQDGFQVTKHLDTCCIDNKSLNQHCADLCAEESHMYFAMIQKPQKLHVVREWSTLYEYSFLLKHWDHGPIITVRLIGKHNQNQIPSPQLQLLATDWLVFVGSEKEGITMNELEASQPVYNSKYWTFISPD